MSAGAGKSSTPLFNPVIWKLTRWARLCVPGLENVTHRYCDLCEKAHTADKRLYAHAFHKCSNDEDTICWSRAIVKLKPNTLAGICLHEFGHILAGNSNSEAAAECEADVAIQEVLDLYKVKLTYRGSSLLQWVDFGRLLKEIEP